MNMNGTEEGENRVLFANQLMISLLKENARRVEDLDPTFFLSRSLDSQRADQQFQDLKPGAFIQTSLRWPNSHRTDTLRGVRVESNGISAFCCVIMPGMVAPLVDTTQLLDYIASYVTEFDTDGRIIYINSSLLKRLGYGEDADGQRPVYMADIDLQFSDGIPEKYRSLPPTGEEKFSTTEFQCLDGSTFPVEVSVINDHVVPPGHYLMTARDISQDIIKDKANAEALSTSVSYSEWLQDDNDQLRTQLQDGILGKHLVYSGKAYGAVMKKIKQVAPTDAPVLITGETGTGKELIARTVHDFSKRSQEPLVIVDCNSIPEQLIESELFGYRKGAFAGATKDYEGRFAAADGGTIFFDEISEMPLLLQSRLLRVLQDGTFTPLGQNTTQYANFRIIAATSNDLSEWVKEGKFRADLYYRLNVFPIHSIPLRERKDDLQVLISHFVQRFNKKYLKRVIGVDEAILEILKDYSFPGNVRELENIIERAFIVSSGNNLPIKVPGENGVMEDSPKLDVFEGHLSQFLSLEDHQRRYVELVLQHTDGKVSGMDGAADILKINPQTLFSRMKKLGIKR